MKATLIAVALAGSLGAFCPSDPASAQKDQQPAPAPEAVAPPGIIVTPPRLPAPMSVPAEKTPIGNQDPHTCPASDERLQLIG
jgi:hypothetical protein